MTHAFTAAEGRALRRVAQAARDRARMEEAERSQRGHSELTVTGTPQDIFDGNFTIPIPDVKVRIEIRCRKCNHRLFDVDSDLWESRVIHGGLSIKCKCGEVEDFSLWR